MDITITKEKFLELLKQFEYDEGFMTAIIYKCLELMPTKYSEMLFSKVFYEEIYKGRAYALTSPNGSITYHTDYHSVFEEMKKHNDKAMLGHAYSLCFGKFGKILGFSCLEIKRG